MRRVGRPGLIGLAARTAVVAGTATAVSGGMRNRQDAKAEAAQAEAQQEAAQQQQLAEQQEQIAQLQAQQQAQQAPAAPAAPAAAPTATDDLVAQIEKLAQLKAAGALTDAEYDAAKAKLLGA